MGTLEQRRILQSLIVFFRYISQIWVYLGIRTCERFLCFVAIVRVRIYYVDFFGFFLFCFTSLVSFTGSFTEAEPKFYTTIKEASTAPCSVVKDLGSGRALKKNTRLRFVF